ncbi:hypothetical protein AURDEDRAFT_116505 [Auricularia subglabra TFB-10046 SS5]|nr:hypothetical protein AURDEDRAFT_116505 [Auricularia subglabra TFB-10046 SS5]
MPGEPPTDTLMRALLSNFGEVDQVSISQDGFTLVYSATGKRRGMSVRQDVHQTLGLWRHLCEHHSAAETVRSVAIWFRGHWDTWAHVFRAHPPQRLGFTLRVGIACFAHDVTVPLPTLRCPSLVRVRLISPQGSEAEQYGIIERAVLLLASGIIASDQPSVCICVCRVLPPRNPESRASLNLLAASLTRQYGWRTLRPVWIVCDHAAVL